MKVIALLGDINTGKSHAINVAYSFLLRDGYAPIPGHFRILGNPAFEDVFDVLQKGGRTVGIIGMGDYVIGVNSLKNLLHEMNSLGCNSVICSCRNNPKIEDAVAAYPSHVFVPKTLSTGREMDRIMNTIDADILLSHI